VAGRPGFGDKQAYDRKIVQRFGGQRELELFAPNPALGIDKLDSMLCSNIPQSWHTLS